MDATPDEEWRPVYGWEELYEVSNLGRVRSRPRVHIRRNGSPQTVRGRILKPWGTPPVGYPAIRLGVKGRDKQVVRRVHILVLEAFVGPRPEGMVGCHNDGDHLNNHLSNLRWDSQSENMRDVVKHGKHAMAKKTHCKRNHEFTEENTYLKPSGGRQCKQCVKDAQSRRNAA